jgi:hypothetical protein
MSLFLLKCRQSPTAAAEVVGSNPTRSISSNLVKYGIKLSLFSVIVRHNQQQQQPKCALAPKLDNLITRKSLLYDSS